VANTRNRAVRLDDYTWHALGHVAADEGSDRTTVLRECAERRIKAYIRKGGVIPPMPDHGDASA
jgi:hypothetical protein